MTYRVVFTASARRDLLRLYRLLDERDPVAGGKARMAMRRAVDYLSDFPFSCRRASPDLSFLRETIIPFRRAGYVALFEIRDDETVAIVAVRHQREADYFD
ncbi:type II toxin-antitoxin system RelE/ParE family toxin [Salinisphaera sp. RV14]|uniref:type II toxin-antitoxin system RelE/ParE family toxin n=1 Tax=Salinisphaera sp. RV14 TaxID=3454140 RepID=UPI003F84CD6E